MDREKQIEEMATVINEMDERNAHYYDEYMGECEAFADANAIAEVLYDAGYRKQNEGEWLTDRFGLERSICSVCGAVFEGDGGNYCPNCGAKMNRGEK